MPSSGSGSPVAKLTLELTGNTRGNPATCSRLPGAIGSSLPCRRATSAVVPPRPFQEMRASGNLTDRVVTSCHSPPCPRVPRPSSESRAALLTNRRGRHRRRGQPHVDVPVLRAGRTAPGNHFLVQLEHPGHQVLHRPGWCTELEICPFVPINLPCGGPGARWLTANHCRNGSSAIAAVTAMLP